MIWRLPSTKHFVYGLLFLSVVFLVSSFLLVFLKQSSGIGPARHFEAKVSGATLMRNYTAHYPVFDKPGINNIMRSYVEEKIRSFEQKVVNKRDIRNHLDTSFRVTHLGSRTVSVSFLNQERIVGQPDVVTTEHFVFNISEDRLLTFQDVISSSPSAEVALAHLLYDYFKVQPTAGLTPAELVGLLEVSPADLQEFTMSDNGLIVYFNPHRPTDRINKVAVRIEKTLLSGILLENYRQSDPEKGIVAKGETAYHIVTQPPSGNTINPAEKMIALTFDDGPSYLTPALLDTLNKYEARATFFVLGKMVASHAAIVQRMVNDGNEVGNHSWGHPMLPRISEAELQYQIDATQSAVQAATGGYTPVLMRPPYGMTNTLVHQALVSKSLHETLWSVDTNDWHDRDSQLIYDRIMASARDGQVVLLHDIHPTSVEAAVRAIRELKLQGFQMVTVSQLFQYR